MTEFHLDQRVRLALDATVSGTYADRVSLRFADVDGDDSAIYDVPLSAVEAIVEPVKVGDVLNGDSPEPPVGTIVFTEAVHPSAWQRQASVLDDDQEWIPSNTDAWGPDDWHFVSTDLEGARVVYLPDADA